MLVVRLNTSGSLDTGFGATITIGNKITHTGLQDIDFDDDDFAHAVAIDDYNGTASSNPDYGKIVVAGGKARSLAITATWRSPA